MAAHLSALAVYAGLPFANLIFPWAIARWKGANCPEVADAGLEALNFQLTSTLCGLVCFLIGQVTILGWLGVFLVSVGVIYFAGVAADRARSGEPYRYPVCVRFFRSLPFLSR